MMSRSRRNHRSRPAPVAAPPAPRPEVATDREQVAAKTATTLKHLSKLFGLDGYSNAAAFLGDDSPLIASGTFQQNELTHNYQLLTAMYRSNWICKRIIDMPADDMTRAWYQLSSDISEEQQDEFKRLEARHSIKQEIANAIRWARLYGGSMAVMIIRGDEDHLDEPLDYDLLLPGCFQGLLVVDRAQGISPSLDLESDLDDPDFGLPMYYDVNVDSGYGSGHIRVHHSRVLRFVGRELPHLETVREEYWGASEMEHIFEELQKRSASSANIAQLIFQANITTLKMADFAEQLALGTDTQRANILSAIETENRFRTSYGLQLLNSDDQMESHQYTFTGLSDVYEQFMMDMAGAAEIPATKLFGRSPQGLNSTGESDLRNYYESIASLQERLLRPALMKLIPIMAISCWGDIPDDFDIVFTPLMTPSQDSRASQIKTLSEIIFMAFEKRLISLDDAIAELKAQGEPLGMWTKIGNDYPVDAPENEDDPAVGYGMEDDPNNLNDPDAPDSDDAFVDPPSNPPKGGRIAHRPGPHSGKPSFRPES